MEPNCHYRAEKINAWTIRAGAQKQAAYDTTPRKLRIRLSLAL